jgi:F420-0:gamma-glutamyl ligase
MQFIPVKTSPLLPPKDDLFKVLDTYLSDIQQGDILFITSKIIAIHQGRCVPIDSIEKKELIRQEADHRVISDVVPGKDIYLTIKDNILIPSEGIDESNANGHYILRPENLKEITKQIYAYVVKRF